MARDDETIATLKRELGARVAERVRGWNGDDIGSSFDLHSFEGIIIHIHLVCFRRDFSAELMIVDDDVSVATYLKRAFARIKSK